MYRSTGSMCNTRPVTRAFYKRHFLYPKVMQITVTTNYYNDSSLGRAYNKLHDSILGDLSAYTVVCTQLMMWQNMANDLHKLKLQAANTSNGN